MHLNCGEKYEDMIDHHSYTHNLSSEIKAWKNSGLNGIRTHDLYHTGNFSPNDSKSVYFLDKT